MSSSVDTLIVCALREELDALLEVRAGVLEGWTSVPGDPQYWTATLDGAARPIRVVAVRATEMGSTAAAELAGRLTIQLEPRSLAMCGVCAGHPDDTDLGDVIIADRVFQHDNGKLTDKGFRGDLTTHMPDDRWVRAAQDLARAAKGLHGYAEPEPDSARWWFLERLYTDRHPQKSGFARYFTADRRSVLLEELLDEKLVRLRGEAFILTKKGRDAAARRRTLHGMPAVSVPYHVHTGVIGSGNYVVARRDDWDRIAGRGMRKLLGLEMEVAAIGAVARRHGKPFVVAKGVMDHGDKHKTDRFKDFAARASAEVLCHLLRQVLVPEPTRAASASPPSAGFEHPHPDAHFAGRVDELADLEQFVQDHQTVCVVATGIGGIGKTTLVTQFAAMRAPQLFPDGVAWIDGSPEQFLGELDRVCRRFGWAHERSPTSDEAQQHLRRALAGQRVLLVVDNFDPAKTPAKYVPIPGAWSRTLVTSRTRTLDVELDAKRLELGVWPLETCRAYLRDRCERLEEATEAELDALAKFVGRLPLGVKLLVAVLRRRIGAKVSELLERLRAQPLGTLDQHAPQDRGVAATFRVGYDDLPKPTREVLQALAVCARQTRRDIVAAVSEIEDAHERLDELQVRGFAEFGDDRTWGMHDVVRMFVRAQPGREGFEQRHTAWVRAHLEAHADPTDYQAFAEGVDEARHAFERLVGDDLAAAGAIYDPLVDHLRIVGRNPEAMGVSERLLAAAPPDSADAAVALNNLALCYRRLGDIPKAIELLERSLAIDEKLGRLDGQASALGNLGLCYQVLGDIPKAIELHERSLAIEEKLGRLDGQASDLGNLGLCYRKLGDIPKAIELHERSLAIEEKLGRLDGQASQLGNLGLCYEMLGDIPKAIDLHERSLAIEEKLGRLDGQASELGNLGFIAQAHGTAEQARGYLTRARDIFRKMGLPDGHPNLTMAMNALAKLG